MIQLKFCVMYALALSLITLTACDPPVRPAPGIGIIGFTRPTTPDEDLKAEVCSNAFAYDGIPGEGEEIDAVTADNTSAYATATTRAIDGVANSLNVIAHLVRAHPQESGAVPPLPPTDKVFSSLAELDSAAYVYGNVEFDRESGEPATGFALSAGCHPDDRQGFDVIVDTSYYHRDDTEIDFGDAEDYQLAINAFIEMRVIPTPEYTLKTGPVTLYDKFGNDYVVDGLLLFKQIGATWVQAFFNGEFWTVSIQEAVGAGEDGEINTSDDVILHPPYQTPGATLTVIQTGFQYVSEFDRIPLWDITNYVCEVGASDAEGEFPELDNMWCAITNAGSAVIGAIPGESEGSGFTGGTGGSTGTGPGGGGGP
ncbi:MAG: hypothetical protein VX252_02980 [Myxococcota bacterium]|nr:hypothetical protein [Myxococcota bacterium]